MVSLNKKSQAQQVFIFMLAIFLAAMILLFGYKIITSFMGDIDKTALIDFQTKIEGGVRKMSTKYNSVQRLDLRIPGGFNRVCILEQGYSYKDQTSVCPGNELGGKTDSDGDYPPDIDYDPILCQLWPTEVGQENVYLYPFSDAVSIKTGKIKIGNGNGYLCLKPVNGQISLRLEGRGDHTIINKWQVS